MSRSIKFKAKSVLKGSEGKWVTGYYFVDYKGIENIYDPNMVDGWFSHPIDPKTLCQFTGKTSCKGNEIFENCIVFDEVAEENGDMRYYYVCKWIEEVAGFAFLALHELYDYEEGGYKKLDQQSPYTLDDSEIYHYTGNYIDNPELLEKGGSDEN